jgi:hypothetical protein
MAGNNARHGLPPTVNMAVHPMVRQRPQLWGVFMWKTSGIAVELKCAQLLVGGPLMVAQWSRYCATDRKVVGSIPDGVIGIFHRHNPSDRNMALGSSQPPTETSTRSISWG